MKILWFTWKDLDHPRAGGAEIVHEELAKRLAAEGHEVVFIVPNFPGGKSEVFRDGYNIVRIGNSVTVYWKAFRLYRRQFKGWADLVVDSYFTIPFFAKFYVREKNILFVHNLCRKIWFYQMAFPANLIGYLAEPIYLRLISSMNVITISQSTKDDLIRFGFRPEHVTVISEGIRLKPVGDLSSVNKFDKPTLLSLGSIRGMKLTDQAVRAFEIAKKRLPNLQLIVVGKPDGAYGAKVLQMIKESPCASSIEYLGSVDEEKKIELMQRSHLILVTSIKEGWGLIVTEANSQGTPAVVYNVDGLRDSVKNNETGCIATQNTPQNLADKVVEILRDKPAYERLQKNAWEWSKQINFDNSYRDFLNVLNSL